jgi:magnesium-protoporphyrin O-methyltransferase
VRTAVHVEGVSAYVAAARAETDRRGQQERVRFLQGDAVVLGASLAPADLVTLDRVVCCYPDLDPLVRVTTALAHRYYAISFPHDRWYMRRYTAWQNRERRRAENPFRTFVHQGDRIGSLIRAAGLRPMRTRQTFAWAVQLYARLDAA